ncbi:hypothetical protein BG015_005603 [Linnemannia schmuckeri]|uniref:Uncharacterized protein n=1 Tax=Linnemannia schmuckeri TaxID=64567 RepID=A0A9P5S8X3_9FUNG|nr:hypothetical protein BG015_005603 [Linnemannia schmuckeri]
MAMLSTHCLSRRHLARVRKQRQIQGQEQDQPQNSDTKEPATQQGAIPSLWVSPISVAVNSPSHAVTMEDAVAASESNPITQKQPARTGKSATQRKRKQERDRKKVRAQSEKQWKPGHGVVSQRVQGQEEMKEDDETTASTSNEMLGDKHHDGYKDDDKVSTALSDTAAELDQIDSSSPLVAGSDIAAFITEVAPLMFNAACLQQQPQQPQQQNWHCSICNSSWRQERAWKGHLLSAQHLRHTLATMQQTAPDIQPYGRVDVMASMDPFGWGTGAGVIEEEEEEPEEEEVDGENSYDDNSSNNNNNNNVEGKAVDNEGDDMDMSD